MKKQDKKNIIKPDTIRAAIFHLCKVNPQGLTTDEITNIICTEPMDRGPITVGTRVPQVPNMDGKFSKEATCKHLLSMVEQKVFLYRSNKRNPKTNRPCYFYFYKEMPTYTESDGCIIRSDIGTMSVEATVSVDTLQADVLRLIVNRKPVEEVAAAYRRILEFA